jgi:hypothetical protein
MPRVGAGRARCWVSEGMDPRVPAPVNSGLRVGGGGWLVVV